MIYGDLDTTYTQAAGQYMAQHIKDAKEVIMSGAAHLPSMEQPQVFNEHVMAFLSSLPA